MSRVRFSGSRPRASALLAIVCAFSWAMAGDLRGGETGSTKPDVLMIWVDDLNDWIGCHGGHPLVQTPNIDALAARGTLFVNAHCQAPLCNPSRTSVMLGLRPTTTGIYGLAPWFRKVREYADHQTLPQTFSEQGYLTLGTGKIHHGWRKPRPGDRHREFDLVGPAGGLKSRPDKKLIGRTPFGNHPLMDWGVWPPDNADEKTGDYRITSWAIEQFTELPREAPMFLSVGYFFPHVPCYASQRWFDLYPEDETVLPPLIEDDRRDTPRASWWLHWSLPEPRQRWLREAGQEINLARSYLACISFIDAQVGRLMEALEDSERADNTIVVLLSDHGYHLGEKEITGKNTLWARSTRVPLILAGPGVTPGQVSSRPVELLDLYPTLIDLTGIEPPRHALEGLSLRPQLEDAGSERARPAVTTHNQGNHSVVTERWRYIRYVDGSEELYDLEADPNEWHNLAGERDVAAVKERLRGHLPGRDRGPAPGSASRVLTYYQGVPSWQGRPIGKDDPVPHDTVERD